MTALTSTVLVIKCEINLLFGPFFKYETEKFQRKSKENRRHS